MKKMPVPCNLLRFLYLVLFLFFAPTLAFSQTMTITGPTSIGECTEGSYTATSGMLSYSWSTTGGTIVAGQAASTVRVRWNLGTGVKRLSLIYEYYGPLTPEGERLVYTGTRYIDVTVNPFLPGSISGSRAVCGAASGTLTLSGHTGNILEWQSSTSGGSTWSSISNATTSYSYSNVLVTTLYRVKVNHLGCVSTIKYTANASITISSLPPAPSTVNVTSACGSSTLSIPTSAQQPGVTYFLQTTATGESTTEPGTSWTKSSTVTSTVTYYIRGRNYTNGIYCWGTAKTVTFTIDATKPAAPTLQTTGSRIGAGSVAVAVAGAPSGGSYRLYGGSSTQTSTSGSFTVSVPEPSSGASVVHTFQASAVSAVGCESATRTSVPVTVYAVPVVSCAEGNKLYMGMPLVLTTSVGFDTYAWRKNGVLIPDATQDTFGASEPGTYSVTVTKAGADSYTSAGFSISDGSASDQQNLNYIITNTPLIKGVKDPGQINTLTIEQRSQSINYFDGLGRPMQAVSTQASPSRRDLVQPIAYDDYGREAIKFLPYASNSFSGFYQPNALKTNSPIKSPESLAAYQQSEHYKFYGPASTEEKIAKDLSPFAVSVFESSPLNRVREQGAPGAAWQPHADPTIKTDRTIEINWKTNTVADTIRQYEYIAAAEGFGSVEYSKNYDANQLLITITEDEHQNQVLEYKDKLGRVVLKKVRGEDENRTLAWLQTYYVYDDFGNLRAVLPPLFSKNIPATGTTYTTANLSELCFYYHYDGRQRMIEKHVPGTEGTVKMVYDHWNRLVLTQDENQRAASQWLYTKYDQLNRPILTGFWQDSRSRKELQEDVTTKTRTGTVARFELRNNTQLHGYTLASAYPTTASAAEVLSATYYDDYSFKFRAEDSAGNYAFAPRTGFPETAFDHVIGLVTGSKIRILGGTQYLHTITYYDNKYRPIQLVADNQLGGIDRSTTLYNFPGWAMQSLQEHSDGKITTTTLTENSYDHAGRLIDTWQQVSRGGAGVTWIFPVGVSIDGKKITKVAGGSWGTGGAASKERLAFGKDGWIEFTINTSPARYMVGLGRTAHDASFSSIDYAVYVEHGSTQYLKVYERGAGKGTFGSYVVGDVIRIERNAGTVRYSKNGQVFYTSTLKVNDALLADVAIYNTNTYFDEVRASFAEDVHPAILLASHKYNELGELVTEKLHRQQDFPKKHKPLWKAIVGGEFTSGNSFRKTAPGGWGNSGFVSVDKLVGGQSGWVAVTASEATTARMVGLAANTPNANYSSLHYAWYMYSNGTLHVYESGSNRGSFGSYQKGDVLKVERQGDKILYKKNDQLLYTSSAVSVSELKVAASLNSATATLSGINFSFAFQDPATYELPVIPVYTEGATIPLTFTNVVGGSFSGNTFTKSAANSWTNSGFSTVERLQGGESGYVEAVAQERTTARMIGLSSSDPNQNFNSIVYAWFLNSNGRSYIYERGVGKATYVTYSAGDVFRVERRGNLIVYTMNGHVAYTSLETSTMSLLVDASLHHTGATLAGIKLVRLQKQEGPAQPQQDPKFLQTVDMRYSIRGWLSRMNNATLSEAKAADTRWKDFFGFELLYNEADGALGNTAQFNGNISAMRWSNDWGLSSTEQSRAYRYSYDPANRLKAADYYIQSPTGTSLNNRFTTSYRYDLNGNIRNLTRQGQIGDNQWGTMDTLIYKYDQANASNRLINVSDGGNKAKGFKDGSTDVNIDEYLYDPNGNMIVDKNKGIETVVYNHLNLPELIRFTDGNLISYTYDAAGIKLRQEVTKGQDPVKRTDYVGGMVYVDGKLQFMQHAEGRILFNQPDDVAGVSTTREGEDSPMEYQYNLKDHLGNVHLSFTNRPGTDVYLATMETERKAEEESQFLDIDLTRKPVGLFLGHTHTTPYPTGSGEEVTRLNAADSAFYGPRKTLRVAPGDTVRAQVWAKYLNLENSDLEFDVILLALTGASGYTVTTELSGVTQIVESSTGNTAIISPYDDQSQPKAYLSWHFIADSGREADNDEGQDYVSASAAVNTATVTSEGELLTIEVIIKQAGVMNIELDLADGTSPNPETRNIDIYFDDFQVSHHHSPILQSDDYYPFGLTFNEYKREGSLENKYLYNGQESQNDLDLEWIDYGARFYDPALGRFNAVDPKGESVHNWPLSSYHYTNNNPVLYIDVNGEDWFVNNSNGVVIYIKGEKEFSYKKLEETLGKELTGILSGGAGADAWESFGEDKMFDTEENKYSDSEMIAMGVSESENFMNERGYRKSDKYSLVERTYQDDTWVDFEEKISQTVTATEEVKRKITYTTPDNFYKERTTYKGKTSHKYLKASVETRRYEVHIPYKDNYRKRSESSSNALSTIILNIYKEVTNNLVEKYAEKKK